MGLSFRTFRKIWMGVIALISIICILLSFHLWALGFCRNNSFGALIAIPTGAFLGALWTICRKKFFSPQRVSVEATFVFSLLPFEILLGLFSLEVEVPHTNSAYASLQCLQSLIWINSSLASAYAVSIILLAIFTQFAFDQDIWSRDIDSSPSPFPFPVLIAYAFPCTARYTLAPAECQLHQLTPESSLPAHCLPGCTCSRKLTVSQPELEEGSINAVSLAGGSNHLGASATYLSGSTSNFAESTSQLGSSPSLFTSSSGHIGGSARSLVPIRVPTAMDRRNPIVVTLQPHRELYREPRNSAMF
ncbi:hypothetical protein BJ138DRAFT_15104 [Hygrophoropsis aurantiaca]|uniref:Uncharacterized protein n=1 Tax=Hygrophoropsis aurantiaca TaxID=72124 RepID=A0ACB8AUV6_9AGAM|nr:hypothetical protein BJ138DRAFT_15104 [Hygrophoropsis aurantiaca]